MDRARGGVVTFLFTDLVSSTATAARLGEDAADELRQTHFALLRRAISDHDGEEVKNLGDGIMAAFHSPAEAAQAAVAIQQAVVAHNADHADRALSVRIGLHAGEPVCEDGDYFGTPVVIASRLCAAARGGQILVGELAAGLIGSRGGLTFRSLGPLTLKGLNDPVPAAELVWGSPAVAAAGVGREPLRRPRRAAPRGPDLVGRADEINVLDNEFALAAEGQLRCLLLSADAGLGKTRLAGELLHRHADEATVLQARAHPMSGGVAFGMWTEALDPLLQVLSDDDVAHLCGGFLDDLSGLFHRVAAMRGPWSVAPAGQEAPRSRLMAGLTRMLHELCERGPVVILLDDMHWADASSWEVLRQVARRLDAAPLLLLLTARPVELAEHVGAAPVLFDLEQDGLLTRLDLTPLQVDGLRALAEQVIGAEPKPALVEWVTDRSRGNALFAIGLLRALLDEGADLSAPALTRLPESLSERVVARAKLLPAHHMRVLEYLVVLGRPVALAELIALVGMTLEEISPMLAELVGARVLVETERGRALTYELTHPLVREAAYEQIGGAKRRVLHRQVARMLHSTGHIAEAAAHYARSADPGDPEAVSALLDALREAEDREAVSEALTVLGALVDLLPETDRRWLDVLDALRDRAAWITDHRTDSRFTVAVAALRAIDRQLAEADDPSRRAMVKFRLANFLAWGVGDREAAHELHAAARDLFREAGDLHQMRIAEVELGWTLAQRGDYAGMHDVVLRVAAEAEALGDDRAGYMAWSAVASVAFVRGRFDDAEEATNKARALISDGTTTFRTAIVGSTAALRLSLQGRSTEARRALAEIKRKDPAAYRESGALNLEVFAEWVGGDLRAALAAAQESARTSPGTRVRALQGFLSGAFVAVEMDEPTVAEQLLDRVDAVLQGRDWQLMLPISRHGRGMLSAFHGDVVSAASLVEEAVRGQQATGGIIMTGLALHDLAELSHAIGDTARAAWAAEESATIADLIPWPTYAAHAGAAAAWAALARSDGSTAVAAARGAVAQADATEAKPLQARTRHVLGRALMAGAPTEAIAVLEDAAGRYDECGAVWRRGMVLELLRRQGTAGRRVVTAVVGPGSLTRREREVAGLAAQGLAVKEIATALFVGERTVETHLGNVYAKLGVESKFELVRRAGELGLA